VIATKRAIIDIRASFAAEAHIGAKPPEPRAQKLTAGQKARRIWRNYQIDNIDVGVLQLAVHVIPEGKIDCSF
jgi:hypothetical protein